MTSISEIIINGSDLETIAQATQAAIAATRDMPGLQLISRGTTAGDSARTLCTWCRRRADGRLSSGSPRSGECGYSGNSQLQSFAD